MVTKFSEKFAIIMLKKHKKFCRRGLTNLDFKNHPNTYGTPCISKGSPIVICTLIKEFLTRCSLKDEGKICNFLKIEKFSKSFL